MKTDTGVGEPERGLGKYTAMQITPGLEGNRGKRPSWAMFAPGPQRSRGPAPSGVQNFTPVRPRGFGGGNWDPNSRIHKLSLSVYQEQNGGHQTTA